MTRITYLVLGLILGCGLTQFFTRADAPAAFPREDPAYRSLDANLFQQSSAEYQACCVQSYSFALDRLTKKTEGVKFDKPPAVILDLDETIFDNSAFQATMARSGLTYDKRLWTMWEDKHAEDVTLVPGACEFIRSAMKKDIKIYYISNRSESPASRATIKAVLEREKLSVPDEQILLASETTGSNKTTRRAKVAEKCTVVMLVGDNLRDFDELYRFEKDIGKKPLEDIRKAIDKRTHDVMANANRFGDDWIILPNAMYGEWAAPAVRGKDDLDLLRPAKK